MEIEFLIGNVPARIRSGWFFGGIKLITPSESVWLERPLQPNTYLHFRLERSWQHTIAGHRVKIEKSRPMLGAGITPKSYRVYVDEKLVSSVQSL